MRNLHLYIQIPVWADNDLGHNDKGGPPKIQILSRVIDHVTELKQNTDGGTEHLLMIVSASACNNPPDYKPKYIIHQVHQML